MGDHCVVNINQVCLYVCYSKAKVLIVWWAQQTAAENLSSMFINLMTHTERRAEPQHTKVDRIQWCLNKVQMKWRQLLD